jgi:hypothetical protein
MEGACRHLIANRLSITRSRWSVEGAEAVLKLRAMQDNGDFDEYWAFHLRREHHRGYQDEYELTASSKKSLQKSHTQPCSRQAPVARRTSSLHGCAATAS